MNDQDDYQDHPGDGGDGWPSGGYWWFDPFWWWKVT